MANEEFKEVKNVLDEFGTKLYQDVLNSYKLKGHGDDVGQNALADSFKYFVRPVGGGLVFTFSMADYGDYIDTGTRPARKRGSGGGKMAQAIESWMQNRSKLRAMIQKNQSYRKVKNEYIKRGKPISYNQSKKSLSWAIKKRIHEKGIIQRFSYKGSKFFTSVVKDGRLKVLESKIADLIGKDIQIIIKDGLIKGKI